MSLLMSDDASRTAIIACEQDFHDLLISTQQISSNMSPAPDSRALHHLVSHYFQSFVTRHSRIFRSHPRYRLDLQHYLWTNTVGQLRRPHPPSINSALLLDSRLPEPSIEPNFFQRLADHSIEPIPFQPTRQEGAVYNRPPSLPPMRPNYSDFSFPARIPMSVAASSPPMSAPSPHRPPLNVFATFGHDDTSAMTHSVAPSTIKSSSSQESKKRTKNSTGGLRYSEVAAFLAVGPLPCLPSAIAEVEKLWNCPEGCPLKRYGRTRGPSANAQCACDSSVVLKIREVKGRLITLNGYIQHFYSVCYHEADKKFVSDHCTPKPPPVSEEQVLSHLTSCVEEVIDYRISMDSSYLHAQLLAVLATKDFGGDPVARLIMQGRGGFFSTRESPSTAEPAAKLLRFVEQVVEHRLMPADAAIPPVRSLTTASGSIHHIQQHVERHSVSRYVPASGERVCIPVFSSLLHFITFWKFKAEDELLCMPFQPQYLEGGNFSDITKRTARLQSLYFTSPHQLYALYQLVSSSPEHELTMVAVDGVFGLMRAGTQSTCVITLSSVFPDIPCTPNALVVRRHIPLPKALTTSENGATVCALMKATVDVFRQFTGLPLSYKFVVKDMGAALQKGVSQLPGITPINDIEHLRAAPLGAWKNKIAVPSNRKAIMFDISLLHMTYNDINFSNALFLFFRKWSSRGEETLVRHFRELVKRGVILPFHFRACDYPGYTNDNQSGERQYRNVKGVSKLNEPGCLNTNLGFRRLVEEGIPSMLQFDSQLLKQLDLGAISSNLKDRVMPSVSNLSIAAMMTMEDVAPMPDGSYLCNSPPFLGRAKTQSRIQSFFDERTTPRTHEEHFDDDALHGSLRDFVDRTLGFCHIKELKVDANNLLPGHLRHLAGTRQPFYCDSCPRFHSQIECGACVFITHTIIDVKHKDSFILLTDLLERPFVGRNRSYAKPGRRRARGNLNSGNPSDTLGDLGLPGDYKNAAVEFICSLTFATLSSICRTRRVFPKTADGRTKSQLIQLILLGTYLADNVLGSVLHNESSILARYHRSIRQGDAVFSGPTAAVPVSEQGRWAELFDPLPASVDTTSPAHVAGYFLSSVRDSSPKRGSLDLLVVFLACHYFRRNLLVENNLFDVVQLAFDYSRVGRAMVTDANRLCSQLEVELLPDDVTTVVLPYLVDAHTETQRDLQTSDAFDGLCDALSLGDNLKSCWLKVGSRQVAILKFISPDHDELAEFHVVDPHLTGFYYLREKKHCGSRTIVAGAGALSRYLLRLFSVSSGVSFTSDGTSRPNRNRNPLSSSLVIEARLFSMAGEPSSDFDYVGCGVDGENLTDGSPGLSVLDVVNANKWFFPDMNAPANRDASFGDDGPGNEHDDDGPGDEHETSSSHSQARSHSSLLTQDDRCGHEDSDTQDYRFGNDSDHHDSDTNAWMLPSHQHQPEQDWTTGKDPSVAEFDASEFEAPARLDASESEELLAFMTASDLEEVDAFMAEWFPKITSIDEPIDLVADPNEEADLSPSVDDDDDDNDDDDNSLLSCELVATPNYPICDNSPWRRFSPSAENRNRVRRLWKAENKLKLLEQKAKAESRRWKAENKLLVPVPRRKKEIRVGSIKNIYRSSFWTIQPGIEIAESAVDFFIKLLREALDPEASVHKSLTLPCLVMTSSFLRSLGQLGDDIHLDEDSPHFLQRYNYEAAVKYFKSRKRTSPLALFNCRHVLMPYCGGNHWFLVVVDTKEREIYSLDSLQGQHKNMCRLVEKFLVEFEREDSPEPNDAVSWRITTDKCSPTQNGDKDCGIFVLLNMLQVIMDNVDKGQRQFTYGMEDINEVRWYIAHMILEEKMSW
jgi:hypothetical protein